MPVQKFYFCPNIMKPLKICHSNKLKSGKVILRKTADEIPINNDFVKSYQHGNNY